MRYTTQQHNQNEYSSAFSMETLESREFFSAAPVHAAKHPAPPPPPAHHAKAVVAAKKPAPLPAKKAAPAKTTTPITPAPTFILTTDVVYPSMIGSWSGTYLALPFGGPVSFSLNLNYQKNGSASGTIKLGGMGGVTATMETTFQVSPTGNIQVLIPTANGQVSFTAGLSANGKQMIGRWCSHVGVVWTVGTFVMTKP